MKTLIKLLLLLPIAAAMVACSNSDEPMDVPSGTTESTKGIVSFKELSELYQPIHSELLESLLSGETAMTFDRTGWDYYTFNDGTNKFEYFDMTGWVGFECPIPEVIVFSDGKAWAPYSTFSTAFGPRRTGMAWEAYKKVTGDKSALYVGHDFAYDESTRSMRFLGRDFTMINFSRNSFDMAESYNIEGKSCNFFGFSRTSDNALLEPNAIGFASNDEVAAYIIAKCRETFGDVINLNEIYAPYVELDNPYIDLDDLEKYVAAGADRGAY